MRLLRRKHHDEVELAPVISLFPEVRARDYAQGLMDGMAIALELVIGKVVHDAEPYRGEVPDDLRVYCEHALRRIKTDRAKS